MHSMARINSRWQSWSVWLLCGALLLLVLLLAASLSILPAVSWQLIDPDGRPIAGAYLAYHYQGSVFRVVDSGSYERPGALLRTDAAGMLHLPWAIHLHLPLLRTGLSPLTDMVYAPSVHYASWGLTTGIRDQHTDASGYIRRLNIARQPRVARLPDASADPVAWAGTISHLYSFIRFQLLSSDDTRKYHPVPTAVKQELIVHLLREYEAFMARYATTRRTLPTTPPVHLRPEEHQQWREDQQAHLAREPHWGELMERLWKHNLAELGRRLHAW